MAHHAAKSEMHTELRFVQFMNALNPIVVTEFGMDIELSPEQAAKAQLSIVVTEFGMVIEERFLQRLNAAFPMLFRPVKYCSSSNEVMSLFDLKTVPRLVTAAASS